MAITTTISPQPILQFFDSNNAELSGGKLFCYLAGTTTKQNTFTDATGATPNTNPVILNSRGEANVWLTPNIAYKFVLAPSTDNDPPTNPIWTVDNIQGGATFSPLNPPTLETASFNAAAGGNYQCKTSIGAITATLPASPNQWDVIQIQDTDGSAATNNITINLNGKTYLGSSSNPVINVNGGMMKLQYNGSQWTPTI